MRQLLRLMMIVIRCVPAFFRGRSKQAIVELALRQQLATFAEKGRRPRIAPADRGFWVLMSRVSGRDGRKSWSSSSPTPWFAGIERDSGCTGDRSRSPDPVGLRFQPRCRRSFADSQTKTAGVPGRFEPNSRSSGSSLVFPPSLDPSRNEIPTAINANDGARSFVIIGPRSPRWTSLSSPPQGSDCCTPGS